MIKFTLFICLCWSVQLSGQGCPAGYEERIIKCNGQLSNKCLPVTYSCHLCWAVEHPPCQGYTTGGMGFFNSYEAALATAEKERNAALAAGSKYLCVGPDGRSFKIYLDEQSACLAQPTNSEAVNDLKNKIIPFLQRYKNEISNYKRYYSGQPYKPGAVVKEYERAVKQAEDNVKRLEQGINTMTEQNLSIVKTDLDDIQKDENNLQQQQLHSFNQNAASNVTDNISANTPATTAKNRQSAENLIALNNRLLQNQRQQIKEQADLLSGSISELFNVLQQNTARKYLQKLEYETNAQLENYKSNMDDEKYQLITCDECNGKGTQKHKACNGSGKITCYICNGSGKTSLQYNCTYCQGTGYQPCIAGCSGTGILNCSTCKGTGLVLSTIER